MIPSRYTYHIPYLNPDPSQKLRSAIFYLRCLIEATRYLCLSLRVGLAHVSIAQLAFSPTTILAFLEFHTNESFFSIFPGNLHETQRMMRNQNANVQNNKPKRSLRMRD